MTVDEIIAILSTPLDKDIAEVKEKGKKIAEDLKTIGEKLDALIAEQDELMRKNEILRAEIRTKWGIG